MVIISVTKGYLADRFRIICDKLHEAIQAETVILQLLLLIYLYIITVPVHLRV